MTSVVFLTPWFPNHPGERQGNFVYDSAAALVRRGYSISVMVTRPWMPRVLERVRPAWMRGPLDLSSFPSFAEIVLVRHAAIPRNWLWRASEWCHDRRVARCLERLALRRSATLIHAHTEGEARAALWVGRKLQIPVVVTLHGVNTARRHFGIKSRRKRFGATMSAASRIVLVGESLRRFFRDLLGRDDHFRVVHNGVASPDRVPRPRFNHSTIRFISVSNLAEGKGIDIALTALARANELGFRDWRFRVVGDGSEQKHLMAMSAALGVSAQVEFLGARPHREIFDLLDEEDVFLLPSYREAFGIAYLEAMASGLLAIGVAGEGPEAFIEHGRTGLLVEPKNVDALAHCIVQIAAHRGPMREIALAGAEVVRGSFTWEAHARALGAVYDEVIAA